MSDTGTFTRTQIMKARDADPLWPRPQTPERLCEICGRNIDGAHGRAKTCHSAACKRELRNRRARRSGKASNGAKDNSSACTDRDAQPTANQAEADVEDDQAEADVEDDQAEVDVEDDQDYDDWLRQIETAAKELRAAHAAERLARGQRIDAHKRLAEAISKEQDTTADSEPHQQ